MNVGTLNVLAMCAKLPVISPWIAHTVREFRRRDDLNIFFSLFGTCLRRRMKCDRKIIWTQIFVPSRLKYSRDIILRNFYHINTPMRGTIILGKIPVKMYLEMYLDADSQKHIPGVGRIKKILREWIFWKMLKHNCQGEKGRCLWLKVVTSWCVLLRRLRRGCQFVGFSQGRNKMIVYQIVEKWPSQSVLIYHKFKIKF